MNLYYNTCMLHCFIVQLICVQGQSIHDMIIIENCPIISQDLEVYFEFLHVQ